MTTETMVRLPFDPKPLSPALGAEVKDFDVKSIRPDEVKAIVDYLRECQVLVFRDQQLDQPEMVAFLRLFGDPLYHVLKQFLLPQHPELHVLSNLKTEDKEPIGNAYEGLTWHTDLNGQNRPVTFTILYGVEVPAEGGDTAFASMYKAFEALPAARRAHLEGLKFIYSYEKQHRVRLKVLADKGITDHVYDKPMSEEQLAYAKRRHVLPIVTPNPYNQRLWINLASTGCVGIEGMEEDEGLALVDNLVSHCIQPEFRYDHKWKPRDLVMWDNRGLFHRAGEYDRGKERRLMWRGSVAGD